MRNGHILRLAFLSSTLIAFGCKLPVGEEAKTDPANGSGSTKNWSFTMSLAHNNFTVAQNATDTNIVTFARAGGFTGAINLEIMNQDSGVVVSSEPVTSTGEVTTTRLLTHVNGPHPPFAGGIYNIHAAPVSNEVLGASANVNFSIVRKDGTFINAPTALSVGRGQSIQQRVSIIRTNYTAPVPFVLALFGGAPSGITATFSPNPATDTVTQMTLSVDASVVEGTYNIGVRANEGTVFQGTAPVTLTVTSPGSFTISPSTGTLAVPKNSTVPMSIAINRTNFTGAISFTVTGVPGGVTATFGANPVTGNSVQLSFNNGGSAVAGAYSIVITASAPGLPSSQATVTLNVS